MTTLYRVDYRDQDDNFIVDHYMSRANALNKARKMSKDHQMIYVITQINGIDKFQDTYYNGYQVDRDFA